MGHEDEIRAGNRHQKMKEAAVEYAKQGIPVFPCNRAKRPIIKDGFHGATADVAQIRKWWSENPYASIGMPTGVTSGVWVLDADVYKSEGKEALQRLIKGHGEAFSATRVQKTGGGGLQYFFKHPGFKIPSRNGKLEGPGLDVKGDGGYVIVPPSIHSSGRPYRWLNEGPAMDAPEWLLERVREEPKREHHPGASQRTHESSNTPYALKALELEAAKVRQAPKGTRNEILNKAAFAVGSLVAGGELSETHAENVLLDAAQAAGLPEREARRTIMSGMESGQKSPRQAPNKIPHLSPGPREDLNGAEDWEDPILLDNPSLPNMEPLPGIVGDISQAIATATETPLELATGMVLATVATACQGRFIVKVRPGYFEPLNVWIVVALDSGNRKSTVLNEATRPLISWEAKRRFEMEDDIKRATSKRKAQEARLKGLRSKYGKAKAVDLGGIESEIERLESELVEVPLPPQIWTDDVTTERLGVLLAINNERMSVISTEGGIIETIAGRYSNGIANMDLYLKGHSGDAVRVDRGSRDPVFLRRPALTIGLSPQPDVLKNMANLPGFRGRGFIARAGYLLPKSKLGYRSLDPEPVHQYVRDVYEQAIHLLLDIEPGTKDRGEPVFYFLELSQEAYQEWLSFAKVVEVDLREGGRFEFMTDWAGKLPGFAVRLAGLLHCVKDQHQPWVNQISFGTMKSALGLASIFASHAEAAYSLMGADKDVEGAKKVWRWIQRERLNQFLKRDCHQSLKGTFPRVRDIEPCLAVLEERHYITEATRQNGGRPSVFYNVNPKLTGG